MGNLNFKIKTKARGFEQFDELRERVSDLSPAYKSIIALWAEHNLEKFSRGEGAEAAGVDEGANVWWAPLTPKYMRQKRRKGWPDSIMVATGALKEALSTEEMFAEYVSASQATFGTPLNDEEQKKVGYNWVSRPTIFLDQQDKLAIQREIGNYLNMGENYREMISQAARSKLAMEDMDAEFTATIGD